MRVGYKLIKPLEENYLVTYDKETSISSEGKPYEKLVQVATKNTSENTYEKYSECAKWCNNNNAHIEDKGDYYEVVENKQEELTEQELAEQLRHTRDFKLSATDKYFLPDYPEVTPEVLEQIKVYRQALRDIPEQSGFPKNVQWPVEPQFLSAKKGESIGLAKVGI